MGAAIIPAAIAGGASILGGMMGNAASAKQARLQRDFEERMSSTAWQRGVADMRAAGINPMLAVSEGPASTPGGAMAGVPNPNIAGSAAGSALDAWNTVNQQRLVQLQQKGQLLENVNKGVQSSVLEAQALKTNAEAFQIMQDTGRELAPRDSLYWPRLQLLLRQADQASGSAAQAHAQAANVRAILPQSLWIGRNPRLAFLLGGGALPKLFSSAAAAAR